MSTPTQQTPTQAAVFPSTVDSTGGRCALPDNLRAEVRAKAFAGMQVRGLIEPVEIGISRGSVYCLRRPVSGPNLTLMYMSDELHLSHPFMDVRMLRDQIERKGMRVERRHICHSDAAVVIEALAPQPGTSKRAPGHKIYLDQSATRLEFDTY